MLEGMIPIKRQSTINIRERMLMWRGVMGLTQKELAEKSGVGQPYISYLESGRRSPGIGTIETVAEAMGISLETFLFGDPKRPGMPTYDDGYIQALLDIREFILYKSDDLNSMIQGKGKHQKLMLGLTNKLLLDPDARENFKKYKHKAKFRVFDDGTVSEIL